MSWARGHSSLTENTSAPVVDRCINCGDHEEVQATITMEFGEGNYNSGSMFVDKGKSNNVLLYIEK